MSTHRYPCAAEPPTFATTTDPNSWISKLVERGHIHACKHDAEANPSHRLVEHQCGCGMTWRELPTGSFPDPKAVCPAHGRRQCDACAANPSTCAEDNGGCGFWRSTGMHWDTCPNRVVDRITPLTPDPDISEVIKRT